MRELSRCRPGAILPGMTEKAPEAVEPAPAEVANPAAKEQLRPREIGGPKGPEPTRYGDWEVGGRCTDF